MKILAVDDEKLALDALTDAIHEAVPNTYVVSFSKAADAEEFVRKNGCDVAFLDIQLRGTSGLELALRLKRINPCINIIFVTGYDTYAMTAIRQRCSGYILKPVNVKAIKEELQNLRYGFSEEQKPVHAQTFGNFELFVNGKPVEFESSRSKEVLAFLIDRRGACLSSSEIAAVIWEGNDNMMSVQVQMRKAKASLLASLKKAGIEDIIRITKNGLAVDTEKMSCDYWQLLDGSVKALNSFNGEYMSSFSWGENTLAFLEKRT